MKLSFNKVSLLLMLLLASLALGSLGCAGARHAQYKNRYILSQVEDYVYTAEFARVWAEARALLFTHGYQVRDSGGGYVIETEWGRVGSNARRRYLVAGYVNNDGTSTVRFNFHEDSDGYATSGRDYNLEKELIRRVEPQSWATIQQNAQAYADANTQTK
ncbi:MAG: hypothetical protein FWC40_03965 [Proteobacteria bacterium]|nr:hypothetical protein [Pseudomonadota bacterium]